MLPTRIHASLWNGISELRAAEWRRTLGEINSANRFVPVSFSPGSESALELVRPPRAGYQFRVYRDVDEIAATVQLAPTETDAFVAEYSSAIQHMLGLRSGADPQGLEAVDYAKRVIHDEAAAYMREVTRPALGMTLEDARRLFTLVYLVASDLPDEALGLLHRR